MSTENGYGFVLGEITVSTRGQDYWYGPRYPYKWDGSPEQLHPREFLKQMYKEAYNCRLSSHRLYTIKTGIFLTPDISNKPDISNTFSCKKL